MISVIIRTLNEEKYLPECLKSVKSQLVDDDLEIILVDSGSTDRTIDIATGEEVKIVRITKDDFSFGRSLNLGSASSNGDILVYLSAHCIPTGRDWLSNLVNPIRNETAQYTYGRQLPRENISRFSEGQVFNKYYPSKSKIPQSGYFCNNANSALATITWNKYRFDEDLTGLEDMALAKNLVHDGGAIAYVATSKVEHIHEENWNVVKRRYEREAIALATIDPSLNINLLEASFLILKSIFLDLRAALRKGKYSAFYEIGMYRFNQYLGTYKGSRLGRHKVRVNKIEYFYPGTKK